MSTQQIPNESIPDRTERLFAKPRATSKEDAKEMILDNYYYNSDKNKGKIFLVKQNKFIPLESLDDKLAEYKEKKNSPEFKDSFAFQYDFRIMTLIKEHRQTAENLKRDYADTYNRIMNRLGEASIKLILSNPKEAWKPGSEKILEEYATELGSYKGLPNTTMPPGESPFFIYARSLLPEPIPSEEPTTWPEQGLDKLILESPQFKRTISDAAKTHRAMWRGIIPADDTRKTPIPYESPKPIAYLPDIKRPEASVDFILVKNDSANPDYKKTAPITNRSDLLKALGLNTLEGSELEKEVLEVPQENPGEKKQEMPVQEGKINYDPKDCKRDNVDGKIIRCKEAPNKYQECMRANHIFKTWQCCKPDNHVN